MSIQAIAWVLEHSEAEFGDRLVLLAIANHADADGWNAWPSSVAIAREARVDRATVFRSLPRLVALGELEITESGGGRAKTNHYRLPMKRSHSATLTLGKPSQPPRETVASTRRNSRTGATQNRPEPSRTDAGARAHARDGPPPQPSASAALSEWTPERDEPTDPEERARVLDQIRKARRKEAS